MLARFWPVGWLWWIADLVERAAFCRVRRAPSMARALMPPLPRPGAAAAAQPGVELLTHRVDEQVRPCDLW